MSRRDIAKMLARNAVLGARAETQADYLRAQAERDRAKEVGRALGQLGQAGVQAAQVAANAGLGAYDRLQENQDKKKAEALQKLKLMANQELANQNQFEIDQDAQSITDGDPLLSPLSRSQLASDMQKNLLGAKTKDGFSMVAEPKVKTMPKPIPEEEYQELAGISDARQILGDDLVDAYLFNAGQGPKLSALDKAKLAKSIAETGKLQAETQEILKGKKRESKWAKELLPKLSKSAVLKRGDLFKFNPDKSKMASPEDIASAKKEMVDELVATAPEEIRSKIMPLVEAQITSDIDAYTKKTDKRKTLNEKELQRLGLKAKYVDDISGLQKYKEEHQDTINKELDEIRLVRKVIADQLKQGGFVVEQFGSIIAVFQEAADKVDLSPETREFLRRGLQVNFDLIRASQSGVLSDQDIAMGKDMFLQIDDPEVFDTSANAVKKDIWKSRQVELNSLRPEYRVEHLYGVTSVDLDEKSGEPEDISSWDKQEKIDEAYRKHLGLSDGASMVGRVIGQDAGDALKGASGFGYQILDSVYEGLVQEFLNRARDALPSPKLDSAAELGTQNPMLKYKTRDPNLPPDVRKENEVPVDDDGMPIGDADIDDTKRKGRGVVPPNLLPSVRRKNENPDLNTEEKNELQNIRDKTRDKIEKKVLDDVAGTSSYMTYRSSLASSAIDKAISLAANKAKVSEKEMRMQVSKMLETQGVKPDDPNFESKALEAIGKLTASSF